MPMNLILREKRKEMGFTQEQIAEYLGVSTPAVNKWEKGTTYPDISTLPALARLLNVDLNTLLCFDEGLSEQEIGHFCNKIVDTIHKSGFESGLAMAMEKVQQYPNCGLLIHSTALVLDGSLLMSGRSTQDNEEYDKQILTLYERAVKSGDDHIRNNSIFMLASKYMGRKEYDKAQELLNLLPDKTAVDKGPLQANLLVNQGNLTEAAGLLERKLLIEINEIQGILLSLNDICIQEGNYDNASHLAEISQTITRQFDLWDYNSYVLPFQVALAKKDVQESISLLKSLLLAVVTPWEVKKSPLFQHISSDDDQKNFNTQMLPALLAEAENDPKCAFLHSNAEFQQIMDHYRAKC